MLSLLKSLDACHTIGRLVLLDHPFTVFFPYHSYGARDYCVSIEPAGPAGAGQSLSLAVRRTAFRDPRRTSKARVSAAGYARSGIRLSAIAGDHRHGIRSAEIGRVRRGAIGIGYLREPGAARTPTGCSRTSSGKKAAAPADRVVFLRAAVAAFPRARRSSDSGVSRESAGSRFVSYRFVGAGGGTA